jgi:cell division protein FtsZ
MTPAAERVSRTPRMPRIDAPLPTQNEIRAAQRKERDDRRPQKRHMTLMQRLASIGLGRRAEEDEPKGANAASRTLDPRNSSVHSSVSTTREYPHSFPHNLIDEDALDSPAFLRRRAN